MKPELIEKYADNGELSHYELIDPSTGDVLWITQIFFRIKVIANIVR